MDFDLDSPDRIAARVPRKGWGRPYAAISADIDRYPVEQVAWARQLAVEHRLPLNLTVGELLVHMDKMNRASGRVGYLREDLLRREGAVPTEATVHVDLAGQYAALGDAIREELAARGINGQLYQAIHDAIIAAIQRVQGGTHDDHRDGPEPERMDDDG